MFVCLFVCLSGGDGPEKGAEENESLEEKRVNLPNLQPPYAQLPTSAPRKLKTLYEALASEQSIIAEEQEEELYESSPQSPSPNSSLSGGSSFLPFKTVQPVILPNKKDRPFFNCVLILIPFFFRLALMCSVSVIG